MKIGVNARFLNHPYTGIGQYTRYLFTALAGLYPDVHFVMVTPQSIKADFPKNIELCVLPENFPGTAGLRKTYWEQWQVPRFFLKKKVDLIHFPYPSNPWRKFPKPVMVTVHDTIPWTMPNYRRSLTTRLYQDRCRKALKYADHLFTVSKFSQKELHEFCKIPNEKMSLSYNAPAPIFSDGRKGTGRLAETIRGVGGISPAGRRRPACPFLMSEKKSVLARYGLDPHRRFFFYIGGYDERKNVRTLVKTFQEYIAPYYDVDLVLGGGKVARNAIYSSFDELTLGQKRDTFQTQGVCSANTFDTRHTSLRCVCRVCSANTLSGDMRNAALHSALQGKLVPIGFVEAEDLPVLYQSSYAFVHLSVKEGCNLPLLEAAVSHTPIVASDIAVHREMVEEVAQFCDPHDSKKLAELLIRLLTDDEFYELQKEKLARYHCPFSWQKTAQSVMEEYQRIMNYEL